MATPPTSERPDATPIPTPSPPGEPARVLTPEQVQRWMDRRRRRRRWLSRFVVGTTALLVVAGWGIGLVVYRHYSAVMALSLVGINVRWSLENDAWTHGWSTEVRSRSRFWGGMNTLEDDSLIHLSRLHRVETLSLPYSLSLTDDGLAILRELPYLRTLDLTMTVPHPSYASSPLTDAMIDHLAGLDQLEELTLTGVNITDAGLERFPSLPNLRFLDLSETKITDAALPALLDRLPMLDTLAVERTAVTPEGLAELGLRHPALIVYHESKNALLMDSETW